MGQSKLRGYSIVYINGEWLYKDTMVPTAGNERSCGYCGRSSTNKGHDGCIGTIPEAMNACCGHGKSGDAYIQYWDGKYLSGKVALNEICKQRGED